MARMMSLQVFSSGISNTEETKNKPSSRVSGEFFSNSSGNRPAVEADIILFLESDSADKMPAIFFFTEVYFADLSLFAHCANSRKVPLENSPASAGWSLPWIPGQARNDRTDA
jgi:hypothetical protein